MPVQVSSGSVCQVHPQAPTLDALHTLLPGKALMVWDKTRTVNSLTEHLGIQIGTCSRTMFVMFK